MFARLGQINGANMAAFDPSKHTSELKNKTILITGGDAGIGKQAVVLLAKCGPAEIWIATNADQLGQKTCDQFQEDFPNVKFQLVPMDLASFDSVKRGAEVINAGASQLDLVILNAGVMGTSASLTHEGYEHQFGINYMGHALLVEKLAPQLIANTQERTSKPRVVIVSSYSHRNAPIGGIQFDTLKTNGEGLPSLKRYAQSKLACILLARNLANKYSELVVVAIHPGAAYTNLLLQASGTGLIDRLVGHYLYRYLLFQPTEIVAKAYLWAATTKDLESGEYYEPLGVRGQGRDEIKDTALARKLEAWTSQELTPHLD